MIFALSLTKTFDLHVACVHHLLLFAAATEADSVNSNVSPDKHGVGSQVEGRCVVKVCFMGVFSKSQFSQITKNICISNYIIATIGFICPEF